jgi:hypothetical protein
VEPSSDEACLMAGYEGKFNTMFTLRTHTVNIE